MVNRPGPAPQVMAGCNRRSYVGLGQQGSFCDPSIKRQVASHRRSKCATRPVGRIRPLPLGSKNFLLHTMF